MSANKLWYSCLLCAISAYCTIQLTFLITYGEKEYTEHIFMIEDKLVNNGRDVIMANTFLLVGMMSLLVYMLNKAHNTNQPGALNVWSTVIAMGCIAFGLLFSLTSFSVNCYSTTPACYAMFTPLYGLTLFNVHVAFVTFVIGPLYYFRKQIVNICQRSEDVINDGYEPI